MAVALVADAASTHDIVVLCDIPVVGGIVIFAVLHLSIAALFPGVAGDDCDGIIRDPFGSAGGAQSVPEAGRDLGAVDLCLPALPGLSG